jgi:hypothetical protein
VWLIRVHVVVLGGRDHGVQHFGVVARVVIEGLGGRQSQITAEKLVDVIFWVVIEPAASGQGGEPVERSGPLRTRCQAESIDTAGVIEEDDGREPT